MYILNDDLDSKLDRITIFLNKKEIQQLIGYAKQLLEKAPSSEHYHLSSEDYQKEITIWMYDSENIENFSTKIQKFIKEDK